MTAATKFGLSAWAGTIRGRAGDAHTSRLERMYELAQQPREFTRLMELQQATLLMEGRTGLVLLRDWQCVLRVCTDVVPVEEPF